MTSSAGLGTLAVTAESTNLLRRAWSGLRRRAPVIALLAAAALLFAGVILAVVNERNYQAQKTEEAIGDGRFLAVVVSDALASGDRAAASRHLAALRVDPETEAAAIYDASGALFATYARPGAPPLPAAAPHGGSTFVGNRLVVSVPAVEHGARLGTVYLDMLTEPIASRLQRYIGIGLLVMMAALLVAALGAAHYALTNANAELEKRAVDLAAANRQLRAQIEEREKAEEALRQSQKMEAIGRLTDGVAHDFNNLLTVVAGNLDLVARLVESAPRSGVPPDRLRRLIEAAQRGLGRGERLTRQLLALSRHEPLEARIVDANAMIADFAPLIQRALGEAIELRLRLGDGKWPCRLDPAQFEAAILNLALNARDACEGGGTLTIATGLAPEPPGAGSGEPPFFLLTATDTGSGMPPDVLRRIFEPFYTTKPAGKGSGLGLAQVWAFATQSGGRVEADSEPGRGASFRVYLPLSQEQRDDIAVDLPPSPAIGGSEKILVVEDEDDVREVASATLERLGYRTVVARDGPEALAMLDRSGDFDLLFTDYVMPNGLNGAELARAARRLWPQLNVLVTSGYVRQAGVSFDSTQVEGFPLIAKPYRAADLAARIREALDAGTSGRSK